MSEIKFRFWDSLNKTFWFSGEDGFTVGSWTFTSFFGKEALEAIVFREGIAPEDFEEHKCIPTQFIGLKDKKGKDIYVGDIVETDGSMGFGNYDSGKGSKREIAVIPTGFAGLRLGNEFDKNNPSSAHIWQNYQLWNIHRSLLIIGNIYENTELLQSASLNAL